jgi:hypothetical protein
MIDFESMKCTYISDMKINLESCLNPSTPLELIQVERYGQAWIPAQWMIEQGLEPILKWVHENHLPKLNCKSLKQMFYAEIRRVNVIQEFVNSKCTYYGDLITIEQKSDLIDDIVKIIDDETWINLYSPKYESMMNGFQIMFSSWIEWWIKQERDRVDWIKHWTIINAGLVPYIASIDILDLSLIRSKLYEGWNQEYYQTHLSEISLREEILQNRKNSEKGTKDDL